MRPLLLALSLLLTAPALVGATEVTVHMAGEGKDDLQPVLDLVAGAKSRLWVLAYTLSDKDLLEVLAKKANTASRSTASNTSSRRPSSRSSETP